jgi:AraC family ethanolamine operon transcriptional activator
MNVRELCYERVEQYFADVPWTDYNLLQLTPGTLNFRSTRVDLDGVVFEWNRAGAGFRSREVNRSQGLQFGFVLESPARVMLGGQSLAYRSAVLWPPGREIDYVAPPGIASLIVVVDEALLDVLGWTPSDSIVHAVPGERLNALTSTCRLATQAARSRGADKLSAAATTAWRERVLAALEPVLEPWLVPVAQGADRGNHKTRRWLVKDADRWLEQQGIGRSIGVDACAAALGVSRRSLFRAFREELGMGPQGYLQLVRLHQLRERLLAAASTEASITELAGKLGFTHMGRLSAAYRKHFGEYPKQTLRRFDN